MPIIDTHAHLNFKAFDKDLNNVIEKARKANVRRIIIPGAKIDSSKKAIDIAKTHSGCFAAVGIHPHHIKTVLKQFGITKLKSTLSTLAKQKKVVAVGEIGLDYHQYNDHQAILKEDKIKQKELFVLQARIAFKNNLPIIIHCRKAYHDLFEILSKLSKETEKLKAVLHCFEGRKKEAKKALNMELYIGINGLITYPSRNKLQKLLYNIPLSNLLLETDSPFLTPRPFRESRNEPSFIVHIAEKISWLKKISLPQIESVTSKNAKNLFKI